VPENKEKPQPNSPINEKTQVALKQLQSSAALLEQCWLTVNQFRSTPASEEVKARLAATMFNDLSRKGVEL